MYTHVRQFPRLLGRSEDEIRAVVRRAFDKRPGYRTVIRVRAFVILAILIGVVVAYRGAPQKQLGYALMIAGVGTTALVLIWNLFWLNVVLFRLTEQETRSGTS